MRFRSFALFVLLSCYLVSSSSFVHAGAMRMVTMPMPSHSCGCEHESSHVSDIDNGPIHDCFELCMGVYANLGGVADVKVSTYALLQQYTLPLTIVPVLDENSPKINQFADDPPDLVGFGYAIIGDDVKKLE